MTFEISFTYNEVPFKADVTPNGNDLLVNLTHPVHYETAPTITFTRHTNGTMKYDNTMFDDHGFMPAVESAINDYIKTNNVTIDINGE